MATITNVLLVDDLDGSAAQDTIRFGLDGADYEIDLNEPNAQALRGAFARYVDAARRASNGHGPKRGRKTGTRGGGGSSAPAARFQPPAPNGQLTDADRTAIRTWAAANGITVKERGRIAASTVAEWRAAGSPA